MTQQSKTVCIFGGTGFVGQYVTQELAHAGYRIKVATRFPESVYELKTYGCVGQIVPFQCDYGDQESIQAAIAGCDIVVNLIGILYEKRKNSFKRLHTDVPEMIAISCEKENIRKFVHVSALAIEKAQSKYAQSKLEGEKRIQKRFPKATILRPSVIFGPGDNFFNMFAKLACLLPALPLIGGGQTKFQPVYVGDVAKSVRNIIEKRNNQFDGRICELGGPEVVTFKEIYKRLFKEINRQKKLIFVPWFAAFIQGMVLGLMPKPLLTMDQVKSLKTDNIVDENALTLHDLGVMPTAMKTILPGYLSCYRRGGRFSDKKLA